MKTHETDIPAIEAQTEKKIWIPRPDENHFRTEGDQTAPQSRSQEAHRLKKRFPKERRLLKRGEFQRVASEKKRLVGKYVCIDFRKARALRVGITASTKFGNAPERNRFKRLIRETFRQHFPHLPQNIECTVFPRSYAKGAPFQEIEKDILELFRCR